MTAQFGYQCEYCDGTVRAKRVGREAFKPKKLLINSLEAVQKRATVLRQAQHEREMLTDAGGSSIRPELVKGWTEGFSTASKTGFVFLENVVIGVCNKCGDRYYTAETLKRVQAVATGQVRPERTEQVPVVHAK